MIDQTHAAEAEMNDLDEIVPRIVARLEKRYGRARSRADIEHAAHVGVRAFSEARISTFVAILAERVAVETLESQSA